jgi:hypothetical protein
MGRQKLKAPFPWHGGKSKVAALIWDRLGNPDNYIEPFAGSLAVMLLRPGVPNIETVNDLDCYVVNFWRATKHDPEGVAGYADGPVFEADMHARHRWLVLSDDAKAFRQKMKTDPEYFDPKVAGYWCWGLCMWIGSGWCNDPEQPHNRVPGGSGEKIPLLSNNGPGEGVHKEVPGGSGNKRPILGGGENQTGHGIHAGPQQANLTQKRPHISGSNPGSVGKGIHAGPQQDAQPHLSQQIPHMDPGGRGVHTGRPQLADAYDIGRGVHSNGSAGTCAERRAWLLDWFGRLRDRLRTVRTCCGDWSRVCSSESTTTRLGTTGVFLDPPYGYSSGRAKSLYAVDSGTVAGDVLKWCLTNGDNKEMRIALAGYDNEGHAAPLEEAGWSVVVWKSDGGYGNRTEQGRANRLRERLWFSPGCLNERTLWDLPVEAPP